MYRKQGHCQGGNISAAPANSLHPVLCVRYLEAMYLMSPSDDPHSCLFQPKAPLYWSEFSKDQCLQTCGLFCPRELPRGFPKVEMRPADASFDRATFATLSAHELAWCCVIVELPHHKGGLGITLCQHRAWQCFTARLLTWFLGWVHKNRMPLNRLLVRILQIPPLGTAPPFKPSNSFMVTC